MPMNLHGFGTAMLRASRKRTAGNGAVQFDAVEAVVLRAQWNDGHNYITLQAKGKNINIAVTVAYGKVAELTDEVVSADDSADRSKL